MIPSVKNQSKGKEYYVFLSCLHILKNALLVFNLLNMNRKLKNPLNTMLTFKMRTLPGNFSIRPWPFNLNCGVGKSLQILGGDGDPLNCLFKLLKLLV